MPALTLQCAFFMLKFYQLKNIHSLLLFQIDYLILTHNHSDHNGEAKIILENFIVTYIVVNEYDNSEFSKYNNTLKLKQGSVTPFGLINDTDHSVEFFIDRNLSKCKSLGIHPCDNTATVFLSYKDLDKFLWNLDIDVIQIRL